MSAPAETQEVFAHGHTVLHSCGGKLYRTERPRWRWCGTCRAWIPWPGEPGITRKQIGNKHIRRKKVT